MRKKRIVAGTVVLGVLLLVGLATGITVFWERTGATGAGAASSEQTLYLEGTIFSELMCGCILLDTGGPGLYELYGDLEGFTCGDRVGVWATLCPLEDCLSVCMAGTPIVVYDIVELPDPTPPDPVGGIAHLPAVAEGGSLSLSRVALAGLAAGAMAILAAGAWYARRRRLR